MSWFFRPRASLRSRWARRAPAQRSLEVAYVLEGSRAVAEVGPVVLVGGLELLLEPGREPVRLQRGERLLPLLRRDRPIESGVPLARGGTMDRVVLRHEGNRDPR